jgi:hypothetical protein
MLSLLKIIFPPSHIIIRVFILQSPQNILVLKSNSKQLIFPSVFIQTLHGVRGCRWPLNTLTGVDEADHCFVLILLLHN